MYVVNIMRDKQIPYKKIESCYSGEADHDTSSDSSSSSSDVEDPELVPRPHPINWFNSIQNNLRATPLNSISTTLPAAVIGERSIKKEIDSIGIKRPSTPFHGVSTTPAKKEKLNKPEKNEQLHRIGAEY